MTRTIEVIRRDQFMGTRYRITDERGYCELSVSPEPSSYAGGRHTVTSYGGSLWPHEFPDLFQPLPSSVSLGSGRVAVVGDLPN